MKRTEVRLPCVQASLHQNVQPMLHCAITRLRWSSGLRQLWPYPEPFALSHAPGRWHDRGCMMSALGLAVDVAIDRKDPTLGPDVIRS